MMTSAQVVETSVTVTDNSPFQDYPHPDDHTTRSTVTPGFKPFTVLRGINMNSISIRVKQMPRFHPLLSLLSTLPRQLQSWYACAWFVVFHAAVFFCEREVLETSASLHQLCTLPLNILLDQGQVTCLEQNS